MGIKVANNAFGTLAASITNSDTSITLTTGQGARFPSLGAGDYFYATLIDTSNNLEIVKCTARSTDVLTVVRAQESTTARAYSTGDRIEIRITAATFTDATDVTPAAVSDQDNTSTGFFTLPAGTTAQRPGTSYEGSTRLNTDTGSLEVYDGSNWNAVTRPFISGVTGTIYEGVTSNLVVSGQNFTSTITVRFLEGGSTVADVTGVAVTSGSATVAVPAAVYSQTAGDTIEIKVINSDGTLSANSVNKTVQALPTGGTITTSGGYRIHTFTSSSSFVVPSGLTLSNVEYLVIAGGGSAGYSRGGGGGAGGYRCSVVGESSGGNSSAESRLTLTAASYTVTIGAGGSAGNPGNNGSNSVFGSITSTGGGRGGNYGNPNGTVGQSGGSGGGGGGGESGSWSGGAGTSGQGLAGGNGGFQDSAAGGGGAGQAGINVTQSFKGTNGGNGLQSSINGTATYRSGGGGGWGATAGGIPIGGLGGGGNATDGAPGASQNGTANTGGGGGGAQYLSNGGAGGSGIVIVRYAF